jgi:hypothetical protein
MKHAALAAILIALSSQPGCISAATLAKHGRLEVPVLVGAAVADLVVIAVAGSQLDSLSVGASLAAAIAGTGLDGGIGCILGACGTLDP